MARASDERISLAAAVKALLVSVDDAAARATINQYGKHGSTYKGAIAVRNAVQEIVRPWYPLLNALSCGAAVTIEIPTVRDVDGDDNAAERRIVPDASAASFDSE